MAVATVRRLPRPRGEFPPEPSEVDPYAGCQEDPSRFPPQGITRHLPRPRHRGRPDAAVLDLASARARRDRARGEANPDTATDGPPHQRSLW